MAGFSDENLRVPPRIKMKLLMVFLLTTGILLSPACGQFNLSGDKKDGRGDGDDDFDLDRVDENEIRNALSMSMKNCEEYEHGYHPFRLFNIFGKISPKGPQQLTETDSTV